jgi:flagellar basal body-associated protein FliL
MEPNLTVKQARVPKLLFTLILILILVSLVAGYIYIGMKRASVPVSELPPAVVETAPGRVEKTAAEKQVILDALAQASTTVRSPEEKQAILDALNTPSNSASSRSPEEKQAILDALKSN